MKIGGMKLRPTAGVEAWVLGKYMDIVSNDVLHCRWQAQS